MWHQTEWQKYKKQFLGQINGFLSDYYTAWRELVVFEVNHLAPGRFFFDIN